MSENNSGLVIVGFKAPADLVAWIDSRAREEGITRSAFTRRLAIRERQASEQEKAA